ncbi:MAG TPA: RHS repeat-associated core domain-containing protein, partial [Terriglobales bacterium]|nr:RHS repeat-associated core domain-containing protein [Terriglobales bacterium]
ATYEYGAFGETLIADGPAAAANPFRFSTKFTDDETGLLYYGLRYYSPGVGRWLSRDPIEERGGANLYAAMRNDAVSHRDYLGMALDPSTVDTTSLTLAVQTKPPENTILMDQGEAGITWPFDIVAVNGSCVSVKGQLQLNPTYRPGFTADPYNDAPDDFGQTTAQHERYHDLIAQSAWNSSLASVNYWEGCYCTENCAKLAANAAQARNIANFWKQSVRQQEYDLGAYGETQLSLRGLLDKNLADRRVKAEKAAIEARKAIELYISSSCGKAQKR